MTKPLILILCTGNSCRSQMAEAYLREFGGDLFEVCSAGSEPAGYVHLKAVTVMREAGIDITGHESKSLQNFVTTRVDTVITVCDAAADSCPTFPAQRHKYHWSFADPAKTKGTDEEVLAAFRDVRDRICLVMEAFVAGYRQAQGEG